MDSNSAGNIRQIFMLLTLLVGGVALESQVSLQGSRPVLSSKIYQYHIGVEDIDARLWQDPFQAIYKYEMGRAQQRKDLGLAPDIDQRDQVSKSHKKKFKEELKQQQDSGSLTLLGVLVPGGPYFVDAENRRRTRYAVLSGLASSNFHPENSEYIGYLNGGDWDYFKQSGNPETYHDPVPLTLPFEWFTQKEKNKKSEKVLVLWLEADHFSHEHNGKQEPLQGLRELYEEFFPEKNKKQVPFKLIGPPDSTQLQEMVQEVSDSDNQMLWGDDIPGIEIFSTRATKDEEQILQEILDPSSPSTWKYLYGENILSLDPTSTASKFYDTPVKAIKNQAQIFQRVSEDSSNLSIRKYFNKTSVDFLRTTSTDLELAKALVREFKLRGIGRCSEIALISEWDTDYGRAFKDTIVKAWEEMLPFIRKDSKNKEEKDPCRELKNIHYFSYLRGLDGGVSESAGSSSKKNKSSKPLGSKEESVDFSNLRAEKERQYDYLLRLTGRIEETEKRFGDKEENWSNPFEWSNPFKTLHFEAFGILGSDYYDKLVVLQALRKKFEHAHFFTTDMDARLFHPEDFKHVRNLIVASGFGLRLQDDLQKSIPPFRDTYQTSAYLATLLALESDSCKQTLTQEKLNEWLQARVFEIGRTQAFDLSFKEELKKEEPKKESSCFKDFIVPPDKKFSVHPKQASSIPSYKYPAVIILTLVLIILLCVRFKERWQWVLAGTLILTAYWIGVGYLGLQYWDEEPLAFFEGVSVWPTDFIRLIAVLMTVAVIYLYSGNPFSSKSKGKLEKNWDDISKEFKYSEQPSEKWKPYGKGEFWKKVAWRAAVFVGLGMLILVTIRFPFIPIRGILSKGVDIIILITFILSFATSLHYSGVHLSNSIELLKSFKGGDMEWPDSVKKKLFTDAIPEAANLPSPKPPDPSIPPGPPDLPDSMKTMLNGPVSLRFIARRTDAVDELIYFPLGILTLGVLSRARVFDNWDFPVSLGALFIYGGLYVLFKALKVQREAKQWKEKLIDRLEMQKIHFNALGQKQEQGFLELLIEDTRNFRQGAFMPLAEHPFYRALLLPVSGFGAMALLEYMFLAV
jgi:hypothetical protein